MTSQYQRVRRIPRQAGFQISVDDSVQIVENTDKNAEMAVINKAPTEATGQALHVAKSFGTSGDFTERAVPINETEESSKKSANKSTERVIQGRASWQSKKVGKIEKEEAPEEFEDKLTAKTETPVERRELNKSVDRVALSGNMQGVSVGEETVEDISPVERLKKDQASKTETKQKTTERAKSIPREAGQHLQDEEASPFDSPVRPIQNLEPKLTKREVRERVVGETKSLASPKELVEETLPISGKNGKQERSTISKEENKDVELVSLHGRTLGFAAEEEKPEHFAEKFIAKKEMPVEGKHRSKSTERARLQSHSIGRDLPDEESKDFKETVKTERLSTSKERSKSSERASLHSNVVGFMAEEETPEIFSRKFSAKREKPIETKVRSKSTERALSQSLSVGSDLELESPEDLKSKQPKQESAVGGNVKSQCTEKITFLPAQVGTEDGLETTEFYSDKFKPKTKTVRKTKEVISKLSPSIQNVVEMEDNTLATMPRTQPPPTAQPSPNISESAVLSVRLDIDKEEAKQLNVDLPTQRTCKTSDETESRELLVSEPLEVGLQPQKDSTSALIGNHGTLTRGKKTRHAAWKPTLSENITLVEDTSKVLAAKMEDAAGKVTVMKSGKQLEDFPVRKSVVFGDTAAAEGKVIELEPVEAASGTEAASATKDANRKNALRVSKSVGEEYCDFIIGFNSGNYEMAEVVEPRPSLMRRPLRKSVSEGVILQN